MNPPCKAANCLRIAWSRGLCHPCYTAANKRRAQLQDGGLPRDASWRRAIDELASPTPLPVIQLLDPKREQDYADLASETAEVCDILGVDRTVDYDLVQVARAVVDERDRLRDQRARYAHLAELRASFLRGLLGALGLDAAWDEGQTVAAAHAWGFSTGSQRLADLRDALDEREKELEERRREVETLGRMSADWRAHFEAEEKRHAETFSKLTTEAEKVRELTNLVTNLEAKLSAAGGAPNTALPASLRWELHATPIGGAPDLVTLVLIAAAGPWEQHAATVDRLRDGSYAAHLHGWSATVLQVVECRSLSEGAAIIAALLSLRGIAVPPYPVTE